MPVWKNPKAFDRTPTTNTVGTAYTTGGTGGAGWKSLPIDVSNVREATLVLTVVKGTATKLYVRVEVGAHGAVDDADFFERWSHDGGVGQVDEVSIDAAALDTSQRLALALDVSDVPMIRLRMKADGAADAAVSVAMFGGRP